MGVNEGVVGGFRCRKAGVRRGSGTDQRGFAGQIETASCSGRGVPWQPLATSSLAPGSKLPALTTFELAFGAIEGVRLPSMARAHARSSNFDKSSRLCTSKVVGSCHQGFQGW